MKRIALIIVLFFYLVPAIGITVSVHYCGNQLAGISFAGGSKNRCACGSEKMKRHCCKDEVISFRLNTDQQKLSPQNLIPDLHPALISDSPAIVSGVLLPRKDPNRVFVPEYPPGKRKLPLYLLNECFRI